MKKIFIDKYKAWHGVEFLNLTEVYCENCGSYFEQAARVSGKGKNIGISFVQKFGYDILNASVYLIKCC